MEQLDLSPLVPKIERPLLMTNGTHDILCPPVLAPSGLGARKLAELNPLISTHEFPDIGHADLLECPADAVRIRGRVLPQASLGGRPRRRRPVRTTLVSEVTQALSASITLHPLARKTDGDEEVAVGRPRAAREGFGSPRGQDSTRSSGSGISRSFASMSKRFHFDDAQGHGRRQLRGRRIRRKPSAIASLGAVAGSAGHSDAGEDHGVDALGVGVAREGACRGSRWRAS